MRTAAPSPRNPFGSSTDPKASRRTGPGSAFSLIEILVAVAILAVALVGLTRGLTTALASSRDSAAYSQAVWIAASRIEFLRADYLPGEGESEGTSGPFTWRQTVSKTAQDGLFEVRIAVERTSEPGALYTLSTYVFDPPTSDSASGSGPDKERRRDRRRKGGSR